jgi:dipeptidase D
MASCQPALPTTAPPTATPVPALPTAALPTATPVPALPTAAPPTATPVPAVPTAAPPTTAAAPTGAQAGKVPLKEAVNRLEPRSVWQNFYNLTQVPRPSGQMDKVRAFLVQFGQGLGLETIVDTAGNVIIRKPAATGMEKRKGVILQAHMDMVPQKTADKVHDFVKDPIQAYVDGEWVKADRTTLGADDGIGIAIAMAILESRTLASGPIEVLLTANEEAGGDGVAGLKRDTLKGDILINLDAETEGEFIIGSAGGETASVKAAYPEVAIPTGMAAYRLTVQGLKGGHSGTDINLGRGHAIKLLARLLKEASQNYGARLAQIAGGSAVNAIPREAFAIVCVPDSRAGEFLKQVREFEGIVKKELAAVEPDFSVQATPVALPARVMDESAQHNIIDALDDTPQGVIRMSDVVPGLVETSTNMGIVQAQGGELQVTCSLRSSVGTSLDDLAQKISRVWEYAGFHVSLTGRYAGWNANPNSPILALMQTTYKEMYGHEAQVKAIHAGLECGVIAAKYPNLDVISIGPTLRDIHSPDERLEIASVKKVTDLLLETLKRIPNK